MRNDARPIGEDSPASPVGGDTARNNDDSRESQTHDPQSHVVNREADERPPDAPDDPVMPSSDSALNTRI